MPLKVRKAHPTPGFTVSQPDVQEDRQVLEQYDGEAHEEVEDAARHFRTGEEDGMISCADDLRLRNSVPIYRSPCGFVPR